MKIKLSKIIKLNDPTNVEYKGEIFVEEPELQLFEYDEFEFNEIKIKANELPDFTNPQKKYWFNIHGLNNQELIKSITDKYELGLFVYNDILELNRRSKYLEFDHFSYLLINALLEGDTDSPEFEQISIITGSNYLISFQERKGDHFEHIRYRIRNDKGMVRKRGINYLEYLLIESIIENYDNTINFLKDNLDKKPEFHRSEKITTESLEDIIELQSDLKVILKQSRFSLNLMRQLSEKRQSLASKRESAVFSDLYSTANSVTENLNIIIDDIDKTIDLFFSYQSFKLNNIMKVLTIISAFFIPLTFIAGIYGMNFENIPELRAPNGYFYALGAMGMISLITAIMFKVKKWI